MSASILQFPSRGPAMLDREPLPTNLRRSRAGAVSFTSQEHMGQNSNPARKVIIVRWTAPATGETGAYCANLSSLTIRGAITDDLMNSFRALVPGNLLSALLQACKQSCSRVAQRFHLLLSVLLHGNHHGRRSFVSVQKVFGEVTNV